VSRIAICGSLVVILSAACVAGLASSVPVGVTTSPSLTPSSSARPAPTPEPSTTPTPAVAPADLPTEIGTVAWVRTRLELDGNGAARTWHLVGGALGQSADIRADIPADARFRTATDGRLLGFATSVNNEVVVDVRDVRSGDPVRTVSIPGVDVQMLLLDEERSAAYASVVKIGGGLDIVRIGLANGVVQRLLALDDRFTPEAIPTERVALAIDPRGMLVIDACTNADGCRLWEIPPGAAAPRPRVVAKDVPIVCGIVGVTLDRLVVTDDAACSRDTSDASVPVRAIDRRDGSSHVVTDEAMGPTRVVEVAGKTLIVASTRSADWSRSTILTVDVASRRRTVHASGLENPNRDLGPWLGVSPTVLAGSWVLIAPWGGEATDLAEPQRARLLDLATDASIELPPGTFGTD
jgi:hypothetical protein